MRPETKKLIQEKSYRFLAEGETHKMLDPQGQWIHLRDLRSILDCETELLKKTIETLKRELAYTKYKGKKVQFAGAEYKVAGIVDHFGCLFVQIYDEPPSNHVDEIKLSSVKLIDE